MYKVSMRHARLFFISFWLGAVCSGSPGLSPVWSIAAHRLWIDVGSIALRRLPLCARADLASIQPSFLQTSFYFMSFSLKYVGGLKLEMWQ